MERQILRGGYVTHSPNFQQYLRRVLKTDSSFVEVLLCQWSLRPANPAWERSTSSPQRRNVAMARLREALLWRLCVVHVVRTQPISWRSEIGDNLDVCHHSLAAASG